MIEKLGGLACWGLPNFMLHDAKLLALRYFNKFIEEHFVLKVEGPVMLVLIEVGSLSFAFAGVLH